MLKLAAAHAVAAKTLSRIEYDWEKA